MLLVMGLSAGLLAGCGAKSVSGSEEATAENPMVLTLSHGLSETHTVHIAMEEFAEKVEERTDGRIKVEIFPNAQLGSETESMEQLTAGVIAMTKVASPILATYEEGYNTFGLPYIFDDTEDFYHVMDSDEMHDFFLSTEDEGFVTLTYYTSGARSFYTKTTPQRIDKTAEIHHTGNRNLERWDFSCHILNLISILIQSPADMVQLPRSQIWSKLHVHSI